MHLYKTTYLEMEIHSKVDISISLEIQAEIDKNMRAKLKRNWLNLKAVKLKFEDVGIYYSICSKDLQKIQ